ncbi:hypothetical protein D3C79_691970 [compost metagenome]
MRLPVDIVHWLDGQHLQLLMTIVVPGAAVAAVVQPDPAEFGIQLRPGGQWRSVVFEQQATSGQGVAVELRTLLAFQLHRGCHRFAAGIDQAQQPRIVLGDVAGCVVDHLGHRGDATDLQAAVCLPGAFDRFEPTVLMIHVDTVIDCRAFARGLVGGCGLRR